MTQNKREKKKTISDIEAVAPPIAKALRAMCALVNADAEGIDFNAPFWFYSHTWTLEKEKEYREWLTRYIYEDRKARREFLGFHSKRLKFAKEAATWFVLQYGWKVEIDV